MRIFHTDKGFTLIELMIVVVIIGTLAALAIPRFMSASRMSKISEATTVLKQIYVAVSAYYQETGTLPLKDDLDSEWLNNGNSTLGIDAPSGKPRFAYEYYYDGSAGLGSIVLAVAYGNDKTGDGCPNQNVDVSLAGIIVPITILGIIDPSSIHWSAPTIPVPGPPSLP